MRKFYEDMKERFGNKTPAPPVHEGLCCLKDGTRCPNYVERGAKSKSTNEYGVICQEGAGSGRYGEVLLHEARECPLREKIKPSGPI